MNTNNNGDADDDNIFEKQKKSIRMKMEKKQIKQ